ncbi:hypothetical protein ACFWNR_36675 [Streptomyces virginiae]|uniref:ATP-dependent DNA ligase n=1 Tax=Streptomyces virginiae TaxID=1961 RepID=UPI00366320E2
MVQTRRGALVQDRWPDLVAAAEAQLPHGLVLDGELVVWDTEAGRLSFEALQRRAATRARGALALAVKWPAYFVAFDLLQRDGQELLTRPYVERRALLENLFAEHALTAPWTLCPMTTDLAKAREWLESWTDVSGVEGTVAKRASSTYRGGQRLWEKVAFGGCGSRGRRLHRHSGPSAPTGPRPARRARSPLAAAHRGSRRPGRASRLLCTNSKRR